MGQEASNLHPDTPQFILFGDSLTQWAFVEEQRGFGWFLEQQYGRKVFVRNEGKAGYTSTDLLEDFTRILNSATAPGARRTLLFTIFLGANDACVLDPHGHEGCVPLSEFEANIRMFVETLLVQDAMPETKIVLITPPPINVSSPLVDEDAKVGIGELNMEESKGRPYKTYLSKKRYAERVMEIAREYWETGRVVGVDFWGALVRAGCSEKGVEFCEDRLIGSGLYGVEEFGEGWFTDGLHLDRKGYEVLSESLWAKMMLMWPELRPEALEMPPEVEAVG